MAKPDYSNEPQPQISASLRSFLQKNDLRWDIAKTTRKEISKLILDELAVEIKPKNLARVLFWYCDIYGKWKRKSESKIKELDERGWTKLKTVVESLKNTLGSVKGIDEATILIRSKIETNCHLVEGLPNRLKFWE